MDKKKTFFNFIFCTVCQTWYFPSRCITGGHMVHPIWDYVGGDVTLLVDIDVEKWSYFEFVGDFEGRCKIERM